MLACLQSSPQQAPMDKHPWIPPALLPAEKLQDVELSILAVWEARAPSCELTAFQLHPISRLVGSKGRAAASWVGK